MNKLCLLSLIAASALGSATALAGQDPVVVGVTPNNDKGDPFRNAMIKLNKNDSELYGTIGSVNSNLATIRQMVPIVDGAGKVRFPSGPSLGTYQNGKFTSQPDALQIQGPGSTGDASGLTSLLLGTSKGLALSDDTSIGYSIARFAAAGTPSCKGQDLVDDSVAINAAITYVASLGGGKLTFPGSADCRIANPIIVKHGVKLFGGGDVGVDGNYRGTTIRPSKSIAALITQADLTQTVNAVGMYHITLDGRRPGSPMAPSSGTISVPNLLELSALGGRFEGNGFFYGSGNGAYLHNVANSSAWINWLTNNQFAQNSGWGARLETTDSVFAYNYVGSNGTKGTAGGGKTATANGTGGCIWTQNYGNIRFVGNQIEICNTGVLEMSVDAGTFPAYGNSWIGNFLDLNNTAFEFRHGALAAGSGIDWAGTMASNRLGSSTDQDILVDDYLNNGAIRDAKFQTPTPVTASVIFKGTHNSGWAIEGQFQSPPALRFSGLPADTELRISGASPQTKLNNLTVGPAADGSAVVDINSNASNVPTINYRQAGVVKYRTRINPADGSLITSNLQFNVDAYKIIFDGTFQFIKPGMPTTTTVSGLSALTCDSGHRGAQVTVTDSNGVPTRGAAFTGGGTTVWPGFCGATGWIAN